MTMQRQIAGVLSGLGLAALGVLPLSAQDAGGLRLTFGVAARLETGTNPGLTVPAEPRSSGLSARLSFGLSDETATSALSLTAAGTLEAGNGNSDRGVEDPDLRFSYRRIGATSSLGVSAFLRETDLDTLRGQIFDPDTGEVTDDIAGDGTQRQTGGDLTYAFGEGGPWGGTLSAGLTDTTYRGTTTQADNRRLRAGATLRFALDPATEVTAGLRWSRYDEAGAPSRDTLRPELGLRRVLPGGAASASLFAEDTPDGTRTGLSFGRSWDLPDGALSFSLGATRGVTGKVGLTGALDWRRDLPRGALTAGLRRSVTSGTGDAETIATGANLGLTHELSPTQALRLGLTASETENTATGATTRNAALSATFSQTLPRDWVLDAGLTHRIRDESGVGRATSDTAFLELRRSFEWRR